jgi:hypothetical protein
MALIASFDPTESDRVHAWDHRGVREALQICMRREHLRRTLRIALVVGVILTLINQADVIIGGDATAFTWVKVALNFCVPFVVSNLGLLAGKRAERAQA